MSERRQGQLRRSPGLRAGLAVVLATGAAVVAVPNQTAAALTQTMYGVNRSVNPVLARNSAGFSTQEGASQPRRIQIRPYRGARHAARVVSNAATVRIVEPREAVTPGQTWIFGSDVKARRGAVAHISVSWFDRNGNFLRWTGGKTRTVRLSEWTRVRASLPVPRGARTGRTVVNVLHSRPGSPVLVTRHEVRAPLASSLPARTTPIPSSMQPPAGATLVRDLSRRSSWVTESGANVVEIPETGPHGDVVLRNTLVDGQRGASSGMPSERSDLQGGTVPLGSTRWMIWDQRFMSLPTTNEDRWQVAGPNEIHGETLSQATVMPEISPTKRFRLNANAGLSSQRYFDIAPIVVGEWHQYKFGIHYAQGGAGWIELWRDGVRVMRMDGPTTSEARDGYWKFGNYRNADINGTTTIDISGCRVYTQ
jgi:hypothetical protein